MDIEKKIRVLMEKSLWESFQYQALEGDIDIFKPRHDYNGDYSSNGAMKLSKILSIDSMELAYKIVESLEKDLEEIEKITVVPPGFINFFIGDKNIYKKFNEIIKGHKLIEEQLSNQAIELLQGNHKKQYLSPSTIKSIQYIHSRASSILNYYKKEGVNSLDVEGVDIRNSENKIEKDIIKLISSYPTIIKDTIKKNDIEVFTQYLMELNNIFYTYHQDLLFRNLPRPRLSVVLKILLGFKIIIKLSLEYMGYEAPERM